MLKIKGLSREQVQVRAPVTFSYMVCVRNKVSLIYAAIQGEHKRVPSGLPTGLVPTRWENLDHYSHTSFKQTLTLFTIQSPLNLHIFANTVSPLYTDIGRATLLSVRSVWRLVTEFFVL
jgi:hypothetical protein